MRKVLRWSEEGREGSGKGISNDGACIPEELEQTGRRRRLRRKDRRLVGAHGLCRYLTIGQVIELGVGARTGKATGHRLRGLAGDETRSKVRASRSALSRGFPFRSFERACGCTNGR